MKKDRKISPISVVITVKDESQSIGVLLDSLESQTTVSKEIIIVDGGSSDETVKIIKERMKKNKRIKLFVRKGTSIAEGRNVGVMKTMSKIIAMTDAGCIVSKKWLFNIIRPFSTNPEVGIVSGAYIMTGESLFQEAIKPYLGIQYKLMSFSNFLPSTRSIAFKKSVWEKIGGFSEDLKQTGEDTLFNYQAKKRKIIFSFSKNAVVSWEVPSSLKETFRKFYYYAKGDAQTGIWWHPEKKLMTHNIKIMAIYSRYIFGFIFFILSFFWTIFIKILVLLFLLYLAWAVLKNYYRLERKSTIILSPFIQIISDIAVMFGFASGFLSRP